MITIKQVYDNYPDSDLLPIEVTDETTLDDIEEMRESIGDTLFLFLCRELCNNDDDELTFGEGVKRCQSAIQQINAVGMGLICASNAEAMATDQCGDQPS